MLAVLAYFLFPLVWLVVASTKSDTDLFSTFGLWFADDLNLHKNIRDLFVTARSTAATISCGCATRCCTRSRARSSRP